MNKLFFGGIHPSYKKEMSSGGTDLSVLSPKQVVIPLSQHIGAPCLPLVKVGERVLCGQKIGDNEGLCVPVHSSVSGTVTAIKPMLHPNGQMIQSVIIENDFCDECVEFTPCDSPLEELNDDTVLGRIREAGIVGMGGAAFPGNIKALSALGKVETLIANACECEPYITADDTLLKTNGQQVLHGMLLLCKVLEPTMAVIAIEDNKPAAIKAVRALLKDYPNIELVVLPTRYPQGSEKQLIQAVTKKQVPPGGLPSDVNCVVFNVSTFAAIYKAVRLGMPLTKRIVTVTGEAVNNPQNLIVPIGTPFIDVINAAGGLKDSAYRVINGGPMMGIAQRELSAPVVKATNSVLCLPKEAQGSTEGSVCIRCGKCVGVCPMHLKPLYIARFVALADLKEIKALNVTDCIECGCCSFICPAKLPLTSRCREGKKLLKEMTDK